MKLERKNLKMNKRDRFEYYSVAACALFGGGLYETSAMIELDKALGIDLYKEYQLRPHHHDLPLPDSWVNFLQKLAGPYGHTVLKTYQIKYGVNYEHSD